MRSPSEQGVADARLLRGCVCPTCPGTLFAHTFLPDRASMHTRSRSVFVAASRKTLPLTTMGEEWPEPDKAVFHRMFFSVHLTGISLSEAIPVPLGPRKRGQSAPQRSTTHRTPASGNSDNIDLMV